MDYWDMASRDLAVRDKVLAGLIERHKGERLSGSGDGFRTLANAVVGQQISVAAAAGIWRRLLAAFPHFSPGAIEKASSEELRACGLSGRKAEYLSGIARVFAAGGLTDSAFSALDDDAVRERLCSLRGVGPWTAEMFLIFHLRRPDVLPLGDVGLHRAAARLYGFPEGEGRPATVARIRELGERWRPWRTVAVWHLWRDLDAEPVVY